MSAWMRAWAEEVCVRQKTLQQIPSVLEKLKPAHLFSSFKVESNSTYLKPVTDFDGVDVNFQ